jgi:adhesin transport system outer membrane protein
MTHPRLLLPLILTAVFSAAQAQDQAALKAVAEKALATSPDVTARWHAYQAAVEGVTAARAARGPQVSLTAEAGHERFTNDSAANTRLNRTGVGLNLTQVLWDGLGSQRETQRVSRERLNRFFELMDASETTALEAVRALTDVQRMRRLVTLADENVTEHRKALEKIESRVKAGVGRGVDLEQAQARLALAESNLITERANLHDVVARYQRVVGEAPQRTVAPLAPLDAKLPASAPEAVKQAVAQHPAIRAGIASMQAADFAVKTRESLLQPRVEFRARTGRGNNYNGLEGRRGDTGAEVVLNWRLYDGGADRARVREQAALLGQASDLRDKACRDVTQVAAIAFNDVGKLREQIVLLKANTDAIERARQAYRQQFDIGQRSLLDLLNAENEAYTAQRALANAQFDRALATARTHAALGQLTQQLGLSRSLQDDDATGWQAGDDAPARCPALPPTLDTLL